MGRMNNKRTQAANEAFMNVSTRNRFSNWAPPTKKKSGKGKGKGKGKGEAKGSEKGGKGAPASLVTKMQAAAKSKRETEPTIATKSPTSFSNSLLVGVELSGLDEVFMSQSQIERITELLHMVDLDNKAREEHKDETEDTKVRIDIEATETPQTPETTPESSAVFRYLTCTLSFSVERAQWAMREAGGLGLNQDISGVLDYLCLHLENEELEASFQVRNEHPAEALRLGRVRDGSGGGGKTILKPVGTLEVVGRKDFALERNQIGLERLGFTKNESSRVVASVHHHAKPSMHPTVLQNDELMIAALLTAKPPHENSTLTNHQRTEALLVRAEEVTALASIFGSQLSLANPQHLVVDIHRDEKKKLEIHIFLPILDDQHPASSYPWEPPRVLVYCAMWSPTISRSLNEAIWNAAQDIHKNGEASLFDLIAWTEQHFADLESKAQKELKAKELQLKAVNSSVRGNRALGFGKNEVAKKPGNGIIQPSKKIANQGTTVDVSTSQLSEEELIARKKDFIANAAALFLDPEQAEKKSRKERAKKDVKVKANEEAESAYRAVLEEGGSQADARAASSLTYSKAMMRNTDSDSSDSDEEDISDDESDNDDDESDESGVAMETRAQTLASVLGVAVPIARALLLQVQPSLCLTQKQRRHRIKLNKQLALAALASLGRGVSEDEDWRRDQLMCAAVALHLRRQEVSVEQRLSALVVPEEEGEEEEEYEEEEEEEDDDDDESSSDEDSSDENECKEKLTASKFDPSPYLTSIMELVSASEEEQPWIKEAQKASKSADQARRAEADEKALELQEHAKKVSLALQQEMKMKRKNPAYKSMLSRREKLPAYQMRQRIVKTIESNQVTIISGDTGCGKTTQVPQLVLDAMIDRGDGALGSLLVTQPRRISAVGVSERIAAERCETIGDTVGYSIRLETKRSSRTRLLTLTTGVLLRRLQCDGDLDTVSHIFVDEVHERDLNTDFLLIILRKLLKRRPNLKLILMSATLNARTFAEYFKGFSTNSANASECPPLVEIPGRAHPVEAFYLENVLEVTQYEVDPSSDFAIKDSKNKKTPTTDPLEAHLSKKKSSAEVSEWFSGCSAKTRRSLSVVDEQVINYELIEKLLEYLVTQPEGAILVFLPGLAEITKLLTAIEGNGVFGDAVIYPLHSSLSSADQQRIFQVPPNGVRKIVVATNIAETSITIEDVVYVVDAGRVKENQYDTVNKMPMLVEGFVSRASARQRRGRAGRVRSGIAYHMFSSRTHNLLPNHQLPEMKRTALDELVLQILLLDLENPVEFLGSAVDPPEALAVANSLNFLENLQALEVVDDQPQLTALGYHLAQLPVAPRVGKVLLFGAVFQCVDAALTIAACLSSRSPFVAPFDKRAEADAAKREMTLGFSDHLTLLAAYDSWNEVRGSRAEWPFLRESFLSRNTLVMIEQMRDQFRSLLADIGFVEKIKGRGKGRGKGSRGRHVEPYNIALIKAVLCGGLFPNVAVAPKVLVEGEKKASECSLGSNHGVVYLHPSCINYEAPRLDSRFLIYNEVVKTSKVYLRDATTVSPSILLLFGGRLVVHHEKEVISVSTDKKRWLHFRAPRKVATVVKHLRRATEELLLRKVTHPLEELGEAGEALVNAVSNLLDQDNCHRMALSAGPGDWVCICGNISMIDTFECQDCGRPRTLEPPQPNRSNESKTKQSDQNRSNEGPASERSHTWSCPQCTFSNSTLLPSCEMCGAAPINKGAAEAPIDQKGKEGKGKGGKGKGKGKGKKQQKSKTTWTISGGVGGARDRGEIEHC